MEFAIAFYRRSPAHLDQNSKRDGALAHRHKGGNRIALTLFKKNPNCLAVSIAFEARLPFSAAIDMSPSVGAKVPFAGAIARNERSRQGVRKAVLGHCLDFFCRVGIWRAQRLSSPAL